MPLAILPLLFLIGCREISEDESFGILCFLFLVLALLVRIHNDAKVSHRNDDDDDPPGTGGPIAPPA